MNQAFETKFLSQFFFFILLSILTFIPTITLPVKLTTQNIDVTNNLLDKQMQGIIGIIYPKKISNKT